jgi:hypothetical protein
MSTVTSLSVACSASAWTVIADGATYSAANVQSTGGPTKLAVAATAPAVDSDQWFLLPEGAELGLLQNVTLGVGNVLYGMSLNGHTTVRGTVGT